MLEFPCETEIEKYYVCIDKSSFVMPEPIPIEMEFIDSVAPIKTSEFLKWINICYNNYNPKIEYSTGFKKHMTLSIANKDGFIVEQWELKFCIPKIDCELSSLIGNKIIIIPEKIIFESFFV